MQEFVYYSPVGLDFPIDETILVSSNIDEIKNSNFLVSNVAQVNSEVVADEIDFYIKNSTDPISEQIKNVSKLYEIAATKFDNAKDIENDINIENRVLVIADMEHTREFVQSIKKKEFDLFFINEEGLVNIDGNIGDFKITLKPEDKEVCVQVNQIVWCHTNKSDKNTCRAGVYDPSESSVEEVIEQLRANISTTYNYRKFISYDNSICQYHERREEICGKCEEVCPSMAIVKDDEHKHLEFSQVDCHGCGGCVSVCPSGAIDYAPSDRESLYEVSTHYKDTYPLVIPAKMDVKDLDIPLKEGVLPFAIEGEKFLHESTLLTLAQISGSQIIFYSDFISKGTGDAIRILNDIYQKRYAKDCVLVAMNEEELKAALEEVSFVEDSYYNFGQVDFNKREIFSVRLEHIVGEQNLGVVQTGEHIHYGKVKVNEANCTLCLSCVGACNVGALQAEEKDHSLRLNPSICTSCGYCEASCPEADCITIERDIIELKPSWFNENVLAKDTLFACVECGKEFATTKAVEKIATQLAPIFASDPVKQRSLYCCADCKPKIMMQSYYDEKQAGVQHAR